MFSRVAAVVESNPETALDAGKNVVGEARIGVGRQNPPPARQVVGEQGADLGQVTEGCADLWGSRARQHPQILHIGVRPARERQYTGLTCP